jgi:cell division septal protein FtsQ
MRKQYKKQRKKSRFFVKSLVFILIALAVFSYFRYNNTNILIRNFAKENNLSISEWPDELIELLDKNPETKDFVLNDSEEGKRDW